MLDNKVIQLAEIDSVNTLEMLYKNYYEVLINYGFSLLKDRDEAEDTVQQVFINLWKKRQEIKIEQSIKSYLYTSVYNAALNKLKHEKVRANYSKEVMALSEGLYVQTTHLKDLQARIDWAIGQLPEQCGHVFKLSRYQHLKYQEIADQLGISIKTVENHMGKALKLMREMLKEYLPILIIFLLTNIGRY
jgi:RNA polymerase sigma-70 factor, ECF subfamily